MHILEVKQIMPQQQQNLIKTAHYPARTAKIAEPSERCPGPSGRSAARSAHPHPLHKSPPAPFPLSVPARGCLSMQGLIVHYVLQPQYTIVVRTVSDVPLCKAAFSNTRPASVVKTTCADALPWPASLGCLTVNRPLPCPFHPCSISTYSLSEH